MKLSGKKYSNPPIVEAVCEFRAASDSKWDLTIPGLIYEKIKDSFPNKEQRLFQNIELLKDMQGTQQKIQAKEHILFFSDDRKIFVQVGPRLLAINCLKPYPTWNVFFPKIEMALISLKEIVDIKAFERIGLRYINHIEIPQKKVTLKDYFNFGPLLGQNLPQGHLVSFMVGCVFPFSENEDLCKLELTGTEPEEKDNNAFILDLDYFLSKKKSLSPKDALLWVENAHQEIEKIFEGCITPNLRKLFKESK